MRVEARFTNASSLLSEGSPSALCPCSAPPRLERLPSCAAVAAAVSRTFEQKVAQSHPSRTGGRRDRPVADSLESPTPLRGPPIGLLLLLPPPSVEPGGESEGGGGLSRGCGQRFLFDSRDRATRPSSARGDGGSVSLGFPAVGMEGGCRTSVGPKLPLQDSGRGRKAELSKRRGFPA